MTIFKYIEFILKIKKNFFLNYFIKFTLFKKIYSKKSRFIQNFIANMALLCFKYFIKINFVRKNLEKKIQIFFKKTNK